MLLQKIIKSICQEFTEEFILFNQLGLVETRNIRLAMEI